MIAITTNNSIKVKPLFRCGKRPGLEATGMSHRCLLGVGDSMPSEAEGEESRATFAWTIAAGGYHRIAS